MSGTKEKLLIVRAHRFPNAGRLFNDNLSIVMSNIKSKCTCKNILIFGDFNLPDVQWDLYSSNNLIHQELCNILMTVGVTQVNMIMY